VLLTTFSRTLAFRLDHQADILLSAEKEVRDRITIDHVHKLARDIWAGGSGKRFQALDSDTLNQCLERASRAHKADFPLSFIRSEWDAVVQPGGITSWAEYKGTPRTNRGTPLGARQRQALWNVFETTLKSLEERGLMSWDRLCFEAAKIAADRHRFRYVIADEYQDLGPAELIFLRSLAPEAHDALFLCGDSGQRIYKGRTSWLSLGLDVRGRSSSLNLNYRTTEQIRRFADRILGDCSDSSTGEAEDRKSVSLLRGPDPQVHAFGTVAEEVAGAAKSIRSLLAEGYQPQEIAIFVHGQAQMKDRAEAVCRAAGVACRELSDDSPVSVTRVSVGTMHRAKGLEFKAVLVMGCDDKLLPMRTVIDRLTDKVDRDAFMEQERHLLYVACTRARERLLVTHSGPKSRFL
jgi:superfamily I DNA/RNA helicase